jgi:tetratricopeptide (TPR) repeat protein
MLRRLIHSMFGNLRGLRRGGGVVHDHPMAAAATAISVRRYRDARRLLEGVVAEFPENADAWNLLGNACKLMGEYEIAIGHYRRALACVPGSVKVLSNLGLALREAGRLAEARAALEPVVRERPDYLDARVALALVAYDSGEDASAEAGVRAVLAEDPEHAEAHLDLALLLLRQGRYAEGWDHYEWRSRIDGAERVAGVRAPQWQGEPLADKSILLLAEQGLGDQIMFASCIPDLWPMNARCIVECDARLVRLFERSFPEATVRVAGAAAADAVVEAPDAWAALGSLPGRLRRSDDAFPAHTGYLRAASDRIQYWRKRIRDGSDRPCIGISWRGGTATTRGASRSIPVNVLVDGVGGSDVRWISLQYGEVAADLAQARDRGIAIEHWPEAIDDYDETAALVCALDLVVSVCTAVVHLSGALGRPTWVLVPAVAEWRYRREGSSMPWYPTARLFRQEIPGDWAPVLASVRDALSSRIAAPREAGIRPDGSREADEKCQ